MAKYETRLSQISDLLALEVSLVSLEVSRRTPKPLHLEKYF